MVEENVFLFIPNIIGYARIALAVLACMFMRSCPGSAFFCYLTSALLDAVDGHAARHFNQSTKFGAMLDQLTDRCGTACLMMCLAAFYPSYAFFFQMSLVVDIGMHWIHLHTSLLQGQSSHKFIPENDPYLLRLYYTNKTVLFGMCSGNEIFYMTMYLLHFYDSYLLIFIAVLSFPIAVAKWLMAILQGTTAAKNLAGIDAAERLAAKGAKTD
ncbi:CDP-diacylglycerol--inositol 3-phosphatidyltransferase [Orchesella cincta]|uniref:CDP-diacylglycerol--inositol 3-phosphatidyltransferase n=1 Tax=Orchesella cincta TaxID=48709 RepID=A0A1D2N1R5_ORCCI|nr:CDP-diacylglycerol--inositol 3-phosphatidyltransferase [Orchesella cincta]